MQNVENCRLGKNEKLGKLKLKYPFILIQHSLFLPCFGSFLNNQLGVNFLKSRTSVKLGLPLRRLMPPYCP